MSRCGHFDSYMYIHCVLRVCDGAPLVSLPSDWPITYSTVLMGQLGSWVVVRTSVLHYSGAQKNLLKSSGSFVLLLFFDIFCMYMYMYMYMY